MSVSEAEGKRPQIALLCHSLVGTGGTERVIATLSTLLSRRFDVFEFSFDSPGAVRQLESPARFVPLGPSLQLPLVLRPIGYARDAYRLWQAKRRLGIALTISNLWRADLLSVLSMGPDRKISICHINIVGNATNRLLLRFRPLVSWVYRRFDRVVSVSRPLGDEIRSLYRIPESRCCVIHNCVSDRIVAPRERTDQRTRIIWCGRFVPEKNVLTLISVFAEAVSLNPRLQLVLIGDGPLRRRSESLLAKLELKVGNSFEDTVSDVIFTGFVEDPAAYMARCDFQVLSSIAEGLGMVLIEGFSVAIPALASDCSGGGVHDAMGGAADYRPGRNAPEQTGCGFLLPVPDPLSPETLKIWRDHMLLMAENGKLREELSAGAKARIHLFTADVIAPKWFQLLDKVL